MGTDAHTSSSVFKGGLLNLIERNSHENSLIYYISREVHIKFDLVWGQKVGHREDVSNLTYSLVRRADASYLKKIL